ncbi:MAG: BON domain-containing protein, partial [Proteobacteria bacterium]|nr:BON domain-containing protein [Pseudomonadota bacterium]
EVKIVDSSDRSDEDIARAALMALNWTYQTPEGIKVIVKNGWITLSGDAQWEFERAAAKQSVSTLIGVKGVTNEITLKLKVMQFDVKRRVKDALKRSAENEGQNITVKVSDNRVTLSGTVHSLTGVEDARVAAWNGPG